jgi:hypothetical protein
VVVKATDKNGGAAFLQLVGQATGAIQSNKNSGNNITVEKQLIWWPVLAMVPLILASFWIGRRYQMQVIRKKFDGV